MARQPTDRPPRTFFLNEQHELTRGEREGRGGPLKLGEINWQAKGERIFKTLATARQVIERSPDPVKERRYFLATLPTKHFPKRSENKRLAPTGTYDAETDFSGEHSKVFRRLGMDLLAVADDGRAVVHAPRERVDQLASSAQELAREGQREQSRWVTIDAFETVPASFRVDDDWLKKLSVSALVDAVFELQPVLTRVEVDDVVRALAQTLRHEGAARLFTSWGTDFSGRHWYRGRLSSSWCPQSVVNDCLPIVLEPG